MSETFRVAPIARHSTRVIRLGDILLGGDNPVRVQSMTNTDTRDAAASLAQVKALAQAGCEIVRLAVPDEQAAQALAAIKAGSPVPLIADIHFDHRLALAALDAGVDGLRINPGNIGGKAKVAAVVAAAKERGAPIRIGVNSGSVERQLLKKYGGPTPEAMVESAMRHVALLEDQGFDQIKISLKSSSVPATVAALPAFGRALRLPPAHRHHRGRDAPARGPPSPGWAWASCSGRAWATPCASP